MRVKRRSSKPSVLINTQSTKWRGSCQELHCCGELALLRHCIIQGGHLGDSLWLHSSWPKGPTQEELDFIEDFLEDYSSSDESSDEDDEPEASRVVVPSTPSPARSKESTQTPVNKEVDSGQGQPRHQEQQVSLQEAKNTIELLTARCKVAEQRVEVHEIKEELRQARAETDDLREQLLSAQTFLVMLHHDMKRVDCAHRPQTAAISMRAAELMLSADNVPKSVMSLKREFEGSAEQEEDQQLSQTLTLGLVPPPSPATQVGTSSSQGARSTLPLSSGTIPTTPSTPTPFTPSPTSKFTSPPEVQRVIQLPRQPVSCQNVSGPTLHSVKQEERRCRQA